MAGKWDKFYDQVYHAYGEAEEAARKMFLADETIGGYVHGNVFLEAGEITRKGVKVTVSYHDGANVKSTKEYLVPPDKIKLKA